jgi:diaminopimelate decarboxylase
VWPARWDGPAPRWVEESDLPGLERCDVVGPICETGDFLARGRLLPPVAQGDLIAVFSAGAYGISMSSNYNDHGRPAEVLVDGGRVVQINARQRLDALLETEREPVELTLPVLP